MNRKVKSAKPKRGFLGTSASSSSSVVNVSDSGSSSRGCLSVFKSSWRSGRSSKKRETGPAPLLAVPAPSVPTGPNLTSDISAPAANLNTNPPPRPIFIGTRELRSEYPDACVQQPDSTAATGIVASVTGDGSTEAMKASESPEVQCALLSEEFERSQPYSKTAGGGERTPVSPLPTLWDKTLKIANKKLSENNLPPIKSDSSGENMDKILQDLTQAHKNAEENMWRIKDWRGKEIVVVKMLGKVLGHMDRYAKIVDTAIQHNPDIVSLVWAGIRTIMQVTLKHLETMECLEFALTTVVEKLAICEFYAGSYVEFAKAPLQFDSLLSSNTLKLQEMVDSALPALYACVLVFTVKAREYLRPSTGTKWLENIFGGFAAEIQSFLKEILDAEKRVQECSDIALKERVKGNSKKLDGIADFLQGIKSELQPLTKLDEILKTMEVVHSQATKAEDDRILALLQSLSTLKPLKRHQDVRGTRLKNTGSWLLETEAFRKWQDAMVDDLNGRILCCYGMPGAGKTMISSLVIDHLKIEHNGVYTLVLYSDYRDQTQQTSINILGSLLHQLLTSRSPLSRMIPQDVIQKLEKINAQNSKASLMDILSMLKLSLQQLERTFICIDGLDELETKTRKELLLAFKKELSTTTRFFLTGRPHVQDEVRGFLGPIDKQYEIDVTASQEDIKYYVRSKIEDDEVASPELAMPKQLKHDIVDTLVKRSQGMFLLPALHIGLILEGSTVAERRKALDTLPKGLYETFQGVIERIQKRRSESRAKLGMKVLMWLHFSLRPLKLMELQHALSVEQSQTKFDEENIPNVKTILDSCFGLVIHDKESGTIRFVHFTLEEYFRESGDTLFPSGRSSIAETCLRYLHFIKPCEKTKELRERADQFVFLKYAAQYWGDYARQQHNDVVETLALELIQRVSSCAAQALFQLLYEERVYREGNWSEAPKRFSGLHMAAWFGLEWVVTKFPKDNCWDTRDECGWTPLIWAAYNAREVVVQLLLEQEDVDPNIQEEDGNTALIWAVNRGHEAVVRVLMEREDVDPNIQNKYGYTALIRAAIRGHEAVVRVLMEREDADPNIKEEDGYTALIWAAFRGREAVVRVLTDQQDMNPNIISKRKRTDLHAKNNMGKIACDMALRYGYMSIVTYLRSLEQGSQIDNDDTQPLENSNSLELAGIST